MYSMPWSKQRFSVLWIAGLAILCDTFRDKAKNYLYDNIQSLTGFSLTPK